MATSSDAIAVAEFHAGTLSAAARTVAGFFWPNRVGSVYVCGPAGKCDEFAEPKPWEPAA
jgi:hypothetical protein